MCMHPSHGTAYDAWIPILTMTFSCWICCLTSSSEKHFARYKHIDLKPWGLSHETLRTLICQKAQYWFKTTHSILYVEIAFVVSIRRWAIVLTQIWSSHVQQMPISVSWIHIGHLGHAPYWYLIFWLWMVIKFAKFRCERYWSWGQRTWNLWSWKWIERHHLPQGLHWLVLMVFSPLLERLLS